MKRREFIAGLLVAASSRQARAQQPAKVHRIAMVTLPLPIAEITETNSLPYYPAFFRELRRFGYIEGRNLIVERYPVEPLTVELARDMLRSKPDVILSHGLWARILKPLTTIPIVAVLADPVGLGLVASLARPGGNITGFSIDAGPEVEAKRLQLFKGSLPPGFQGRSPRCRISRERSLLGAAARGGSKTGSFATSPPAGYLSGDRVSTFFPGDGTGTRRLSHCG